MYHLIEFYYVLILVIREFGTKSTEYPGVTAKAVTGRSMYRGPDRPPPKRFFEIGTSFETSVEVDPEDVPDVRSPQTQPLLPPPNPDIFVFSDGFGDRPKVFFFSVVP